MTDSDDQTPEFAQRLEGKFTGILRWEQLEALWDAINGSGKAWFLYQVGNELPGRTCRPEFL